MSSPDRAAMRLEGDCGLRKGAELVAELKKNLAATTDLAIDATPAAAVDISTIQILVSANKTALAAGKRLSVHAPPDSALGQILARSGFVAADGRTPIHENAPWILDPVISNGDAA